MESTSPSTKLLIKTDNLAEEEKSNSVYTPQRKRANSEELVKDGAKPEPYKIRVMVRLRPQKAGIADISYMTDAHTSV